MARCKALCLKNAGDARTVGQTTRMYWKHCDTECVDLNSQCFINQKEAHMKLILQHIETSFAERHTVEASGRRGVKKPHTWKKRHNEINIFPQDIPTIWMQVTSKETPGTDWSNECYSLLFVWNICDFFSHFKTNIFARSAAKVTWIIRNAWVFKAVISSLEPLLPSKAEQQV